MKKFYFALWTAVALSWTASASAATLFSENFEGYTSFPSQTPLFDPINAGIPKLSEGASEIWYGARFETSDGGSVDSDLAIQKYGGGSNMTHTGRFEDDAGLLFKLNTTGYDNVTLSFNWRTFKAETTDRLVVAIMLARFRSLEPAPAMAKMAAMPIFFRRFPGIRVRPAPL